MAKDKEGHGSEKRAEHGKYGNGTEHHGGEALWRVQGTGSSGASYTRHVRAKDYADVKAKAATWGKSKAHSYMKTDK